jgi:hypothetical protein
VLPYCAEFLHSGRASPETNDSGRYRTLPAPARRQVACRRMRSSGFRAVT